MLVVKLPTWQYSSLTLIMLIQLCGVCMEPKGTKIVTLLGWKVLGKSPLVYHNDALFQDVTSVRSSSMGPN